VKGTAAGDRGGARCTEERGGGGARRHEGASGGLVPLRRAVRKKWRGDGEKLELHSDGRSHFQVVFENL